MLNKKLYLPMVGLIIAGLLGGCAGTGNNEAPSTPASSGSNNGTVTGEKGAADDKEQKYKITMFNLAGYRPTEPVLPIEKDPIRQMINEALNIELDMTVATNDVAYDRLNTLIVSNQVPDLIYFPERSKAIEYYNQGVTLELDDLLKTTPDLVNYFDQSRWDPMSYNGNIIGVPGVEGVGGINGWWINNDWLKALNLEVPTTTDELLNVMKAFTFDDPDRNGVNDTYGFIGGVSKEGKLNLGMENLIRLFGVSPNYVDVKDGKLIVHNIDPRMKEALAFVNSVIEAKVIDPDWVTINTGLMRDEKMYKGKVGIMVNDWRRLEPEHVQKMEEIGGSVPDWIAIPPMKNERNDQFLDFKPFQSGQWAISKNAAKDPGKAQRIIELLQYLLTDQEAYPYLAYGVKGVTWTDESGEARITDKTSYNEKEYDWKYHYAFVRRGDDAAYFDHKNPVTAEVHALNLEHIIDNNVNPLLVPDPKDTLFADRENYINEMFLRFATGKEPLSKWDDYIRELENKFKLNELLDNYTEQLKALGILE